MKPIKIISVITAAVMLTGCCAVQAFAALPPQVLPFGDMNHDDKLTVSDATAIQRAAAEIDEPDEFDTILADVNHDKTVSVADATLVQKIAAEMEIPEDCGGYLDFSVRIYDFYADYISGTMPEGAEITFTAAAFEDYVTKDFRYEFLVDDEVVQPVGSSDKFTYAFDKAGTYTVTAIVYNRWGITDKKQINYTVLESIDLSKPRIINSKVSDFYLSIRWEVESEGGSIPHTYRYIIENEYGGLDNWDIDSYNNYTAQNETDWKLCYHEDGAAYYEKDFSTDNLLDVPTEILCGGWYKFTVTAKDADGNLSEPKTITQALKLVG